MMKLSAATNHWLHIFLSLAVLVFSISFISSVNKQSPPKNSQILAKGKALFSDRLLPPPLSANWKDIRLPDDWFRATEANKNKWYRFELPSSELPPGPWALYLTNTTRPVTVYINNQLVHKPELQTSGAARIWGQPQLIDLKIHELASQKLIINIMLPKNQSSSGLLGPVYIGPKASLYDAYQQAYFVKVYLVRIIVFAMALSSLLVGMLWLFRRRDTTYAFYAVAVITWAIYSYGHIPLRLPVSGQAWEWLRLSMMVWWSVSISFFCNRFLNSPQPRIERILVLHTILISVGLALIDAKVLYWLGDYVLPAYATLLGLYPSWRMLRETIIRQDPHVTWLTMCGMMVMLLASHDIIVMGHWLPSWQTLYLHNAALVLLLVFNIILLKRFVGTLNEVEILNKNLELRVKEKAQKLKENYQKLYLMKKEKLLTIERERIMHDMHDGVGGTLVSMRAALERGSWTEQDVFDGLGSALDDLYMMIHSLDPYGSDLAVALGSIRHILENRLRHAGIELRWVVKELPQIDDLSPATVLSVMRIMQEAITNVIKHSDASQVVIRIPVEENYHNSSTISLSITDNGRGINLKDINQQDKGLTGYGLSGMQHRAEEIAAKLSIIPMSQGTRVLLQLPCRQ